MLGRPSRRCDCVAAPRRRRAIRRLAEQHLDRLRRARGGTCRADRGQDAGQYLYLGLLAALFPRATFIHCRRDLRDVAVSCWMTDFRSIRWANDSDHIAGRSTSIAG